MAALAEGDLVDVPTEVDLVDVPTKVDLVGVVAHQDFVGMPAEGSFVGWPTEVRTSFFRGTRVHCTQAKWPESQICRRF